MKAIPTLHHLEIFALREHLHSSWREFSGRVPELPRLDAQRLETLSALIETNALLRRGVYSLRAGRSWLIGMLIGLLVALQEHLNESPSGENRATLRDEHLERRTARPIRHASKELPNRALRFKKSCVLWARFLS